MPQCFVSISGVPVGTLPDLPPLGTVSTMTVQVECVQHVAAEKDGIISHTAKWKARALAEIDGQHVADVDTPLFTLSERDDEEAWDAH